MLRDVLGGGIWAIVLSGIGLGGLGRLNEFRDILDPARIKSNVEVVIDVALFIQTSMNIV